MRSGLTYYLPRREVKVSAERKLLKKADVEKAITAAKAKLKTAEEAAATAKTGLEAQVALLPTLTQGSGAWNKAEELRATYAGQKTLADAAVLAAQAEVAKGEADLQLINAGVGSRADAEKAIAAAKTKLTGAEQSAAAAKSALEAQERLLLSITRGTDEWTRAEARRVELAERNTTADAAMRAARVELAEAEGQLQLINAGIRPNCTFSYSAKVELLAPVADLRHRFVADLDHSPFRDDELKLAVNANGLLTSANVIAADRTGDILVEAANALSSFGMGGMRNVTGQVPSPNCADMPAKFVYQFDPAVQSRIEAANSELARAKYPFRVQIDYQQGCKDEQGRTGSCLSAANREVIDPVRPGKLRGQSVDLAVASRRRGRYGALFYPSSIPATVVLRQCESGTDCTVATAQPIDAALAMVPQAGPVSFIPMQSSAFVRTVDDVVFDNGMIASWNASRPSELLEVVRLPVKILTAVLSAPAQIISLRVNLSDKDKALAESQQAEIAAQTKLTALRTCIEVAEREERSATSCFVAQ
jgi:hypothetical protein